MSRLFAIILILFSSVLSLPVLSASADEEYFHAHKIRSDIRYPGFFTILNVTAIDAHRFAVFTRGVEYAGGYQANRAISGFVSTDNGKSTQPGVFFRGIGGSWGALDLDAVWPGDLQQSKKKHGLLFAAITGDYDGSLPYFAVARFNNKGRPAGTPETIFEVEDVRENGVWLRDAWIAATVGSDSIGVAFSYVFRDPNISPVSDYHSRAFFAEFDFEGNMIGSLREIQFPPPADGHSYAFKVFAPGNLDGTWLLPAAAKHIQGSSRVTVQDQLFITVVKQKDPINARAIERTSHLIDADKDFLYSSLQFVPEEDNESGVAKGKTLLLFAQQRNFNPTGKPEVKEYDSEYYLYTINRKGRQAANRVKMETSTWFPKIELEERALTRFEEIVSRARSIGNGRYMFFVTRDLTLTTQDKYQFSETEGHMFVGILDTRKKQISIHMSDLFADYYYFRVSDGARKDLLAFSGTDRIGFVEGCGGDGYSEEKKNWMNTVLIDPVDSPAHPPARADHTLIYDTSTKMPLLFGGASGGKYYNDMWHWDGSRWSQVDDGAAPPKRSRHAMAYDQKNGNVVLFGGHKSDKPFGDTWIWDGNKWQEIHTAKSPSARQGHTMVYDPNRKAVILFGGRDGNSYFNDLWTWNGRKWRRLIKNSRISPRAEHCMVWDATRKNVVVFGGRDAVSPLNDTWSLKKKKWTLVSQGGKWVFPDSRSGAAMAYIPDQKGLFLFGGVRESGYADDNSYVLPSSNYTWSHRWPPTWITGRAGHAIVYDEKHGYVLMFGGWNDGLVNSQTWIWDGTDWFNMMP